jgi:peptide/nickel transport system substrate-binding protein
MSVTWELRPGIKWSDGTALTSADIKFTWETWMKDPKVVNRAGYSEIESIDTPNELTAVVNYKSVYAPYPLNFGGLLPKHVLTGVADVSQHEFNRKPIGTGPFRVVDFKAGDSITVERNPNYREAGRPYLDKIIFKSVPTSEVAIAQLRAGEVHGMWNILESQTPDLEKDQNLTVLVTPSSAVERIELNTAENKDQTDPDSKHPVLGDIEVRKALLWATPKQQIIDKLLFGKAKVGTSGYSQGWAKYAGQQDGYDPKKASEALDKAGWVKGSDGIRTKGGVRASLTFITTTGNKTREQVQQVLADEYKQIGIELKIQNMPSSVFLSGSWAQNDPRKRGTFDLNMYATSPGIDPHTHIFTRQHSTQVPSAKNGGVGQNYTRFKSPAVDAALDEAGATLDLEKRKAAYARAIKAINDAYVIIFLYDRANIDAHRKNVQGWKGNVWDEVTWNVQDWWLKQ